MKMSIGIAMAAALMLSLPTAAFAQEVPAPPTDNAADVSAGAVDTATQETDNASNAAIDAADNASDAAGDAIENSADDASGATQEAADDAKHKAEDAQQASDDAAKHDDEAEGNEAKHDDEAPKLDDDAQLRADAAAESFTSPAPLSDEERNADWRFVERDGVWWYRTPMNTWMVHQDGEWQAQPYSVGYRGARNAQYYNDQHSQPGYREQHQAVYNDGYQNQGVQQTAHHEGADHGWGEDHPSVGQQEWMCIDGRRTLVTIVSVSPASSQHQGQQSPERAARYEDEAMPAPPEGGQFDNEGDNDSDAQQTPPPVPQPGDSADNEDHPDAPSQDRLQASSGIANGQAYSAAKPMVDGQPNDAATLNDTPQAPAEPQPAGAGAASGANGGVQGLDDEVNAARAFEKEHHPNKW